MSDLEEYLLKAARMRPPTAKAEREELTLEEVRTVAPTLRRRPAPTTADSNATVNTADSTAASSIHATSRASIQPDALLRLLANPSSLAQTFVLAELLKRPVERWERNW